jgi:hypothetical protein
MSRSFDPDDPTAIADVFAGDLRAVFPEAGVPSGVADDHVAAMMAAAQTLAAEGASVLDPASRSGGLGGRPTTPRRRSMLHGRMLRKVVAVAAGVVLSLGGLALASAFSGSDDPGDDGQAIVADLPEHDPVVADDQGEDGDDQGEDADDQGEDADDQGEDGDDQGEDGDDQGEDADDQGEDADDQGEDGDDQGEDGDDQGEDADDQGEDENDAAQDVGGQDGSDDSDGGQDDQGDDGGNSQD